MTLATAALDLLHRHPGRKRKSTRRLSGNRSPRETVADIVSIGVAQRVKFQMVRREDALDARNGSTLGQLVLEKAISPEQLSTAQKYALVLARYARLRGIPSPHARSAALLTPGAGYSCDRDFSADEAAAIKEKFKECRKALLEAGSELGIGSAINAVVYGVVVDNWPISVLEREETKDGRYRGMSVQNLRCGLNALARVLG